MTGNMVWGRVGGEKSGPLQLANSAVFDVQGSGNLTIDAEITEFTTGQGVTRTGGGSGLVIFNSNMEGTYTGATTVTEGTLRGVVGGNFASSELILNGVAGTFQVFVDSSDHNWTCEALTAAAAGTLEFNFGDFAPSNTVSPLIVTKLADFTLATPAVSVLVSSGLTAGTYPLVTWGSALGAAPTDAELTISTLAPATSARLGIEGNTLNLVIENKTLIMRVKDDNATDLNVATAWVGGTAPGSTEVAKWDSTVTSSNTTILGANLTWGGIVIEDPAGLVTVEAGNTLTLGYAPVDLDLSAAETDLTLNCPLAMEYDNLWDVAAGRTLGMVGLVSGSFPVGKQGDGTAVLFGANTYTGDTSIHAGFLRLGAPDVIPDGGGNGNVVVNGTLDLNGFSEGINGLSGSGVVDNTAASGPARLTVGGNNQSSNFSGILQNSGSFATLDLIKEGNGTLTLSGPNTYTGTTTLNGGTLALSNVAALSTTAGLTLADGTVLRAILDGITINAPITVGTTDTNVTISTPTNDPSDPASATVLTLNGAISGEGGVTFASVLNSNKFNTVLLAAQSNYLGGTLISKIGNIGSTQTILKLGIQDALPTTTVLTIDGGLGAGSGRVTELNLNGFDQELAGLTNLARATNRLQRIVNSDAEATATLTINNANDHTFTGHLGGNDGSVSDEATPGSTNGNNFNLVKSGTGKFTLGVGSGSGRLSYDGDTTVNEGILSLGRTNGGNDRSTIRMAPSGAKLELAFGGTDTVASFLIGTNQQSGGVYGHTDSGADNGGAGVGAFDDFFEAGPGTITVPIGDYGGYADWAATNAPGESSEDDFDGDGVSNGLEYVLGGGKNTNDLDKLPTSSTEGGNLIFTFFRDPSSIDGGNTTAEIEVGTTLTSWPDSYSVPDAPGGNNPGVTVVAGMPSGFDTVTLRIPLSPDTKKFARLRVGVK